MRIQVVTKDEEDTYSMEVAPDLTIQDFRAFLSVECGLPPEQISLSFETLRLDDEQRSLQEYGISDGELLVLDKLPASHPEAQSSGIDWSAIPTPSAPSRMPTQESRDSEDPEVVRHMFLSNPYQLSLLKERNPPLAEALLSGDLNRFKEMLERQRRDVSDRNVERIRALANPFSPSNQEMIAEEIRKENIQSNMESAIEFNPESFGQVIMLYIECKVNGHPVKAFVDSGAQMTIMSAKCAERCNVIRLVDHRFSGMARGVGTQKIVGRVHMSQIQIESDFLTSSFSILEEQPMDMLLGLDMLKRHQCCIDLKKNVLRIGTTGTETPFLAEKDLPLSARAGGAASLPSPQHQEAAARQASLQEEEDRQLAKALEKSQKEARAVEVDEAKVLEITQKGFSRQSAVGALQECSGDVNRALGVLLARSLGM